LASSNPVILIASDSLLCVSVTIYTHTYKASHMNQVYLIN